MPVDSVKTHSLFHKGCDAEEHEYEQKDMQKHHCFPQAGLT
jgi:hypothetical protein